MEDEGIAPNAYRYSTSGPEAWAESHACTLYWNIVHYSDLTRSTVCIWRISLVYSAGSSIFNSFNYACNARLKKKLILTFCHRLPGVTV